MSDRPRVLVLAYLISPVRGSEYAVAWNYVQSMRSHCNLTVLYGSAGAHMGDVSDFSTPNFVDRTALGDVAFHFVPEPPLARRLNALNRRGILTYSFYIAYRVWHRAALIEAKRLIEQGTFDLIHYVGPIGYREPGYLWQIALPYVWGPIGGATSFPWRFRSALSGKGRLRLMARTLGNLFQLRYSRRVTKAIRRADALLTATTENQEIFRRLKGVDSWHIPENGIEGEITLNLAKFPAKPIRIIWIGSLEARKGLILLIEAVSMLRDPSQIHIEILGDGPLREDLIQRTHELGIAKHFTWHGHVSRDIVLDLFDRSHLHVITGLNEANTTSLWEALKHSVPVLTLDHCGMRDVIAPAYGIGIRVLDPQHTCRDIAAAIEVLSDAPERLEAMARSCAVECDRFRIVHRPRQFLDVYETAIARYRAREGS